MSFLVWLKRKGQKGRWDPVPSLLAAGRAVRDFIIHHPDGPIGSDWEGGLVKTLAQVHGDGKPTTRGKVVARVSSNGRIWHPTKGGVEIKPTEGECLWDAWRQHGDLTALGALADWMEEGFVSGNPDHPISRLKQAAFLREVSTSGKELGKHIHFFFLNAGCGYNPTLETKDEGWLRGATKLAEAEVWLEKNDGECEWLIDDDYSPDEYDAPDMPNNAWGCIVRVPREGDPPWGHRGPWVRHASLWAITFEPEDNTPWFDPDDNTRRPTRAELKPYARVVQAELALELMQ